jgi:diguanylate cyclase (GGDEF)-like protein
MYSDAPLADRLRLGQRACLARLTRHDTFAGFVRDVQQPIDPDQVARVIVDAVASWIPLHFWALVAPDAEERLAVAADTGDAEPDIQPLLLDIGAWVLRHDTALLSGDVRSDDRLTISHPSAVLAVPLRGREQVVGVLVGLDPGVSRRPPALSPALGRALDGVLSPSALALDTARLLRRTEALSVTDDLTRLYNARYLNMALRRETRLAVRNGRSLSLLFIDLDGFKSINDRHGHLAGSRALMEAGAVIRGSARETDIVARFGGDEFALILPDTASPGALAVAERIRDRIARHSFLAGDGLDVHLTASVGVATVPDVAAAADELVQAADAAMYQVKDRGKNGVQTATSDR